MKNKQYFAVACLFLLSACQTDGYSLKGEQYLEDTSGPGPKVTGGYLVDYQHCNIGSDLFAIKGSGKRDRVHLGIDIKSDIFVPIIAAAPGEIVKIIRDDDSDEAVSNGALILLRHGNIVSTYVHLEQIPKELKLGSEVKRGQVIGLNGLTGRTQYPHVHFSTHYYDGSKGFKRGSFINSHSLWYVEEEKIKAKTVTIPFFDKSRSYDDDQKMTFPMRSEDCGKEWVSRDHPTKPWRAR
ncbi:exported hypothetical protein [Candidatus Terasakiella magnetica]|uniref:M23ase beta-sheet core domain-containing protein n=1 Tax=Candidatus Terasakiella magnetica TaxID=1867952 RepID=A0A1C3REL7_9PROT|nr:M23 family metallopeptidase [Candidatus Terasakiella magnetica]SCA55746.1 exported hypothetical protein [Candidatus Terasakiella magnetica]